MEEYDSDEVLANLRDLDKTNQGMITWVQQGVIEEKELRDRLAMTENVLRTIQEAFEKCEEDLKASRHTVTKLSNYILRNCPAMALHEALEVAPPD